MGDKNWKPKTNDFVPNTKNLLLIDTMLTLKSIKCSSDEQKAFNIVINILKSKLV